MNPTIIADLNSLIVDPESIIHDDELVSELYGDDEESTDLDVDTYLLTSTDDARYNRDDAR